MAHSEEAKRKIAEAKKAYWADRKRNPKPKEKCKGKDCPNDAKAKGWCSAHYNRKLFGRDMDAPLRPVSKKHQARYIGAAGYVYVWVPEGTPGRLPNGHMLEHRKVMQDILGRPLLPHETIHHINANRQDNHPENLELRVGAHGVGATGAHCHTCTCFDH